MKKNANVKKQMSGWTKVGGEFNENKKFEKPGDSIEGIFVSSKEIKSNYKAKGKKKKGSKQTQTVYTIKTTKGKVDIFGSGLLDYLMLQVKLNGQVKIVYQGKKLIKGNKCKQFDVYTK